MAKRYKQLEELLTKGKSQGEVRDERWSPNNIKTVIITESSIMVEHFTVEGSANGNWFETAALDNMTLDDTSILTGLLGKDRGVVYSAIEEIVFIVTPKYYKDCFKADFMKYYDQLQREVKAGEGELLKVHPRLYAMSVVYAKESSQVGAIITRMKTAQAEEGRKEGGVHYYDKLKEWGILHNTSVYCNNKDWWKAGIYDDKIKERNKRVLRPWLYALDENPASNPDAKNMPVYRALMRIAKPKLDAIQLKEKEENENKIKTAANNKALEADKKLLETRGTRYNGLADYIFKAQSGRKDVYTKQLQLNENNMSDTTPEQLSDISDKLIKSGTAMSIAYTVMQNRLYGVSGLNVIIEKIKNTPNSKAVRNILNGLNYDYIIDACEGYPDLQAVASALKTGYRFCLMSNIGLNAKDTNQVVYLKTPDGVALAEKEMSAVTKHYAQINRLNSKSVVINPEKKTATEPQLQKFFMLLDCILEAELYLAYSTFVHLMPLWVGSTMMNNIYVGVLQKEFNKDKFLPYNTTLKAILHNMLTSQSGFHLEWESAFSNLDCSEFIQGRVCKSVAEYTEIVSTIYNVSDYIIRNRLA